VPCNPTRRRGGTWEQHHPLLQACSVRYPYKPELHIWEYGTNLLNNCLQLICYVGYAFGVARSVNGSEKHVSGAAWHHYIHQRALVDIVPTIGGYGHPVILHCERCFCCNLDLNLQPLWFYELSLELMVGFEKLIETQSFHWFLLETFQLLQLKRQFLCGLHFSYITSKFYYFYFGFKFFCFILTSLAIIFYSYDDFKWILWSQSGPYICQYRNSDGHSIVIIG